MSLPANFSEPPAQEPHRYFRNICIQFRKIIKASKNINELQELMEKFIDASRQMNWHPDPSEVYHKDQSKKATDKMWVEFKRYIHDLQLDSKKANPQDFLEALAEIEKMIQNLKVT